MILSESQIEIDVCPISLLISTTALLCFSSSHVNESKLAELLGFQQASRPPHVSCISVFFSIACVESLYELPPLKDAFFFL